MRNHARVDAEFDQHLAPVLAVHDDAIEAGEQPAPQVALRRRTPRQEIVCGEDRWHARAKEPCVQLGRCEPLHVQDVRAAQQEGGRSGQVLGRLEGQPEPGTAKQPRAERIERLAAAIAVRSRDVAEPKLRGDELDVRAGPRERGGQRVVVRGREGGRVGEDDAHAP